MARLAHFVALTLFTALAGIGSAHAIDYPVHSVKWVVPYPPAGTTDVLARIIAQWLSEKMGQQFIVENKPGAGNNIGVEAVVNSPPDGYTMLLVNPANGINATLYKNLSYNFIRDIAPVAGLVRTPNVMEVTHSFPAKTVAEFIAYCKANPGKINMASSGSGTSVHLSGELFKSMTGCNMLHVPYKGAGPALTDLIAGQVHVLFDNLPSSIGHIKGGSIRALAVTSAQREPSMPDLPTVGDTVPGLRGHRLVRHRHAQGDAERDHREGQCRGEPRARRSEDAGAIGRAGWQADRRHAGGLRKSHRGRDREVAEGRELFRRQGGVSP